MIGGGVGDAETGLVFKVVREERGFDVVTEFVADGFAKVERAEMAGGLPPAAMTPGTKDHEDAVSWVGRLVVGLEGGVFGLRPPEVFLIPPAAHFQRGNGDLVEVVLDGAESPEVVVGGVVEEGLPGGKEFGSWFALCGFGGRVDGVAGHRIG